jgi:small subunit ribosomal protein S20
MANIRSSTKDLRRSARKRIRNQAVRTSLKTYIKKVKTATDAAEAQTAMNDATKALDKAVQRGIIHKNQAARRKSRAAKAANALKA